MMQHMMNNPAVMQQSMQMAQQMFGGQQASQAGSPQAAGNPNAVQQDHSTTALGVDGFARAQFATQLAQLSAMGFCNEAACLQALQQHHGRVDAAIDALLASGQGTA